MIRGNSYAAKIKGGFQVSLYGFVFFFDWPPSVAAASNASRSFRFTGRLKILLIFITPEIILVSVVFSQVVLIAMVLRHGNMHLTILQLRSKTKLTACPCSLRHRCQCWFLPYFGLFHKCCIGRGHCSLPYTFLWISD